MPRVYSDATIGAYKSPVAQLRDAVRRLEQEVAKEERGDITLVEELIREVDQLMGVHFKEYFEERASRQRYGEAILRAASIPYPRMLDKSIRQIIKESTNEEALELAELKNPSLPYEQAYLKIWEAREKGFLMPALKAYRSNPARELHALENPALPALINNFLHEQDREVYTFHRLDDAVEALNLDEFTEERQVPADWYYSNVYEDENENPVVDEYVLSPGVATVIGLMNLLRGTALFVYHPADNMPEAVYSIPDQSKRGWMGFQQLYNLVIRFNSNHVYHNSWPLWYFLERVLADVSDRFGTDAAREAFLTAVTQRDYPLEDI